MNVLSLLMAERGSFKEALWAVAAPLATIGLKLTFSRTGRRRRSGDVLAGGLFAVFVIGLIVAGMAWSLSDDNDDPPLEAPADNEAAQDQQQPGNEADEAEGA